LKNKIKKKISLNNFKAQHPPQTRTYVRTTERRVEKDALSKMVRHAWTSLVMHSAHMVLTFFLRSFLWFPKN